MAKTDEIQKVVEALRAPFSGSRVQWRVGSTNRDGDGGTVLAYVDKREYEARLDDVFGATKWTSELTSNEIGAVVKITATFPDGSEVYHTNGCGYKLDKDGRVDADSYKGAISTAFKRAASEFGIGRYLYDMESPWVKLNNRRFYGEILLPDDKLPDSEKTGRNNFEIKYNDSKYQGGGSSAPSDTPDYGNAPENVRIAAAFVCSTGFNEGKTLGSIKSEKALGYVATNASSEEERNAAKTLLDFRKK